MGRYFLSEYGPNERHLWVGLLQHEDLRAAGKDIRGQSDG